MNHLNVSIFKSVLRICACGFLFFSSFKIAAVVLAIAQLLGILQELVDTRK